LGLHPAGDTRAGLNPDENATTLCLLVSGRSNLDFDAELVTLARPGDYAAVGGPGVKHRWHALDDSVVLTVRWPSLSP
jgi:quercetin dioxygenase-like cupin family protein